MKSIESQLLLKRRLYRFQLKKGLSIAEHMNDYTNLLTDLVNLDVNIEEEDMTIIFLNSLPDGEYETFILTFINGRQALNYNDMSAALVNYEMRRKDKQYSFNGTSAEALMVKETEVLIGRVKASVRDLSPDQVLDI